MNKFVRAGVACVFAVVGSMASAVSFTPDSVVTPGATATVSVDLNQVVMPPATTDPLAGYQVFLALDPTVALHSVVDDASDNFDGIYQAILNFGVNTNSELVATSFSPAIGQPNLPGALNGIFYGGALNFAAFQATENNPSNPSLSVFDLQFLTNPAANAFGFDYAVRRLFVDSTQQGGVRAEYVTGRTQFRVANPNVIPLPASTPLILTGLAAIALLRRKRQTG